MRLHRHPATGTLIAAAFFLAAAPAAAANLTAYVKDDTGKPVTDAVVYASAREKSPSPASKRRVTMDQRDRQFLPYVLPVQTGTSVDFPNSDNIRHQVYSFSPAKNFELALYKGTPTAPVVFDKPGAVALGCNIHDWMLGYIYVVDSPYFGKTASNGEVRLTDLPAGEYDLYTWHPRLKQPTEKTLRRVTLGASEARAEFTLGLNPDRRKSPPVSYESNSYSY